MLPPHIQYEKPNKLKIFTKHKIPLFSTFFLRVEYKPRFDEVPKQNRGVFDTCGHTLETV